MLWQPTRGLLQPNQSWRRPQGAPAGGGPPLDGIAGLTGAWSMSRALLTAYGGAFYTGTTNLALLDQSGNSRNFGGGGTSPATVTAGANSRTCARFDGVGHVMVTTGIALSNFISATTGYIVLSCIPRGLPTSGASYTTDAALCDTGAYMGMQCNNASQGFFSYNYDGTEDYVNYGTAISVGTRYVVEWRHDSGTLYVRVNGTTENSVASGNTQLLTGTLRIGASTVTFTEMDIFEIATFSSIPSSTERDAIVADFAAWVG